jgi:hypothetical protein
MSGPAGRGLRVVAGLVVVALGLFVARTTTWTVLLILIGLVPLAAGLFNVCVFAPLFGGPLSGRKALGEG